MPSQKQLKVTQPKLRGHYLRVQGTGTAAILEPSTTTDISLTDNGVGDYTLTFANPFIRIPSVTATSKTTGVLCEVANEAVGSVDILCFDVATGAAATDADFNVHIVGADSQDAL